MEIAEHTVNFAIANPSDIVSSNESSEVLSEEAIVIRQRKLLEARKHLAAIDDKIEQLNVMVRRLSPRFHKLQYVLKHRISVFSGKLIIEFIHLYSYLNFLFFTFTGLRSVYLKYCSNLQRDINQFLSFQDFAS